MDVLEGDETVALVAEARTKVIAEENPAGAQGMGTWPSACNA